MWQPVLCPLCGAEDAIIRWRGALRPDDAAEAFACTNIYWSDYLQVVQCRRCGMIYSNPCETADTLLQHYTAVVDHTYLAEIAGRQRTFAGLLARLRRLAPPPATVLDVGCYTGQFLAQARAAGYTVTGLEPSRWAAEHARTAHGLTVAGSTLADLPTGQHFDLITLWDVLEHLPTPHETIAAIAAHSMPGGWLALSTHNLAAPAARLLGGRYPFLMRMHVAHFTPATLARLLAHHGYVIRRREPHVRWLRVGYAREKLERYAPRLHRLLTMAGGRQADGLLIPIAGVGLMNVYARKETS